MIMNENGLYNAILGEYDVKGIWFSGITLP